MNRILTAIVSVFILNLTAASAGNGDGYSGDLSRPNLFERQLVSLVNECRMNPTSFRDFLLNRSDILLPANYPAVKPLRWNEDLGRAARAHSDDMAQNCGMQHNSCDGTDCFERIKSFFTGSGWMGENICSGQSDSYESMNSWLMDGNPPAVDKGGKDGHRSNIMSANYSQIGTGYANGPQSYHLFWTQDFAGGTSSLSTIPLVDGIHYDSTGSSVVFRANWYNPGGRAPSVADVHFENGTMLPLNKIFGSDSVGTWRATGDIADGSRYQFVFSTDSSTFVYPANGWLVTGSGVVYEPKTSTREMTNNPVSDGVVFVNTGRGVLMTVPADIIRVQAFDSRGRVLFANDCSSGDAIEIPVTVSGVVFIRLENRNGNRVCRRVIP